MKKIFIGSLVGAIILFIWSSLAWTVLPLHRNSIKYSPAQDSVLKILADSKMETGVYSMPMVDSHDGTMEMGKYQVETEKLMKANEGKPMLSIYYLKDGYTMSGATFLRGFLINFLSVLMICFMLSASFSGNNSFVGRWMYVLMAGIFITACGPLIENNWMGMPWGFTMEMVMDNLLNWGIVGIWLAYYFKPE